MTSNYQKVREFHRAFGSELDFWENARDIREMHKAYDLINLRMQLMKEELVEVASELHIMGNVPKSLLHVDKAKLAKELADLLYVVYGTAATFGIDIDRVFDEVHQSNMSKLGEDGKPIYREDGKVLKGPNYQPPKLDWITK